VVIRSRYLLINRLHYDHVKARCVNNQNDNCFLKVMDAIQQTKKLIKRISTSDWSTCSRQYHGINCNSQESSVAVNVLSCHLSMHLFFNTKLKFPWVVIVFINEPANHPTNPTTHHSLQHQRIYEFLLSNIITLITDVTSRIRAYIASFYW